MAAEPIALKLFSPQSNRYEAIDKDSRLINGFVERGQGEMKDETWVYRRPGFALYSSPLGSTAAGNGVFNWQGDIYSIFGDQFFQNTTLIGSVDATDKYTFTSCLGATPALFFHNSAEAYTYDAGAGLVQVTDPQYLAIDAVPGSVYIDGTTYVLDTLSNIIGSDFNDQQDWNSLNVIVVQTEPDQAKALAKQLVYAVAMKTISTEVFYDAGNAVGSPLGPVQGSKMNYGCRAAGSVRDVGDALCWATTDKIGEVRICKMEAVKGEMISTQPVERFLSSLDWTDVHSWAMNAGGHRYYGLTSIVSNITLVFDLTAGTWYIWTDPSGNYLPYVDSTYDSSARPVLQHATNGKLYTPDFDVTTDVGVTVPWALYTPNFDGGLRVGKTCASFELVGDQVDADVDVSWSDDDFVTYVTPQTINLNQERPMGQDGSTFRKRTYLFESSSTARFRLKATMLVVQPGTI